MNKCRAWDKNDKVMRSVSGINFEHESVFCKFAELKPFDLGRELSFEDIILMQSTGLKDKNGVEIFFDDVLTNGEMKRKVIWRNDDSQIQLSINDDNYESRIKLTQQMIDTFALEVCGNIYQNPELLK